MSIITLAAMEAFALSLELPDFPQNRQIQAMGKRSSPWLFLFLFEPWA
jgi:hypothetical protein